MKQLGLRVAPLNLGLLSSAGKGWIAPSKGMEVSQEGVHGGGKMESEIDRWIRAASAEGRLSVYQLIYVLTLTYNHELWVKIGKTSG